MFLVNVALKHSGCLHHLGQNLPHGLIVQQNKLAEWQAG